MDNDQFLDAYLNTLETSEGAGGGDTVTDMATREYGVKNLLGVNEEDYKNNPKGLAKAVAQKNIDELIDMGIDWNNLPLSMKFNALDIQYNMGSLKSKAPKYFNALKSGNYADAIKESLDAIGAYDPKRKGERPTKGIALRRAMFYNMAATELNLPTITSVNAINQDNPQKSAKVTYNMSEGDAIPVTYEFQSLHSTTKPGTIAVGDMTVEPAVEVEEGFKERDVVKTDDVVESGTTDMLEEVEQEQFQRSVDAADRDEQKQQMESLLVKTEPQTSKAIPVIDVPVKPEQPDLFDKVSKGFSSFMDMFSTEDTPEKIQEREKASKLLLDELQVETIRPPAMNEGGLASGEIDYSVVDDEYELPTELDIARAKARQQMKDMGLDAPSILSPRIETRTAEEIASDRKTLAEMTPVIGDAMLAKEVADYIGEGSYGSAAIGTAALGVGMIPGAGDILNKPLRAAAKKLRKQDNESAKKLMTDEDAAETWKETNKLPESQRQKRVPEVQQAAIDLSEGKITSKQYRRAVTANQPIQPITKENFPDMPTKTEIVGALKATDPRKVDTGIVGLNKNIPDGTRVGSRLDIPSYDNYDKWIVSLHDGTVRNGKAIGYGQTAVLKDVEFISSAKGGLGIAKGKAKTTIARIHGDYQNAEPENVFEAAKQLINNPEWTQVGMNPFRHSYFYDKATGNPVTKADEVIQVGPLVLAKGVKKPTVSEMKELIGGTKVVKDGKVTYKGAVRTEDGKIRTFNEGGMAMDRQMSMFEDGGLMDEGGTTDPVSGNEVPPGSTQEEVRDDIPAQLSEGEFVFPADVVRFIGLEKLMNLRQEAKAGLARMEAMGQMGNSEEATIPDDIPFTLDDLEMEDDPMEFQVGGLVPNQFGVMEQPSQFASTYQAPVIPVAQPMQQQQPLQTGFTPLTTPAVPTSGATVPTFEQLIPTTTGNYDELKEYINNETGQTMTIPFVDGQPIYPIPEGFVEVQTDVVEAVDPEETVVPTAIPETVTGRDDPSDDNRGPEFATTDVTGIGYDRSGLTDNLRQAVDDYGFGFGALAETFGKAGVAGAVGEAFGKDPRAPTKQLTSATFKGVLESVRASTLEQGIATASLHRVSPFTQDKIAKIADDTFKDDRIKNIFASDSDKKPPTKSQVSTSIKTLASTMQIDMFNPDGTPKTNNQIMTEIGKSIAAEKQAALEAAERTRQEEVQAKIEAQTYKIDPIYQPGGGDDDKAPPASRPPGPGGFGGFTGSKTSSGAGTGAFAGTKQGGPGSFKRGGLASRK